MEPYRSLYPGVEDRLPQTESACACMLCLPTGTAVGVDQIRSVRALMRYAVLNSAEIERGAV